MKLSPLSRVLSAGGAAALVVLPVHPAAMAREVTASAVRSSDVMSQHAEVPGATLWTKRFNGSGNGDDGAGALRVSPDGTKVFVAGGSRVIGGGFEGLTIAYDATSGATLWIGR